MFEQSLIQEKDSAARRGSLLISMAIQTVLVLVMIVIPLIYYEALPHSQLSSVLVAPPPPPPPTPPPPPEVVVKVQKVIPKQFDANKLMAPKTIQKIAKIVEEEAPAPSSGVVGGVPGGMTGGVGGGVLGGILGGIPAAPPPPPPKKEEPKPTPSRIRVGGNVQSARIVRQPKPTYPPLAKQARIQGTVRFEAVIAKDGTIQQLRLVSGHPLLIPSAQEAVKQWVYQPTQLNGEPVEVATTIDVNFTLSQ